VRADNKELQLALPRAFIERVEAFLGQAPGQRAAS
jgi:hypothetical protein